MSDRIDDLLDLYLETGEMPADASDKERAELEDLARMADVLAATSEDVTSEASAAMPVARARFERFLDASEPVIDATPRPLRSPRGSLFERMFGSNRGLKVAGVAAIIGVIAVLAVFAAQNLRSTTETAVAQVLEPGDYAQVYGTVSSVVTEDGSRTLFVSTDLGELQIGVDGETSVVESNTLHDLASIQPGARLLIAGLVERDRRIIAQTLAIAGSDAVPVAAATVEELKRVPPDTFAGRILLVTLAGDGAGARVVVLADDGTRYVVRITRANAGILLAGANRLLGTRIMLSLASMEGFHVARLAESGVEPTATAETTPEDEDATPATEPGRPAAATATAGAGQGFSRTEGVILERSGNVLTVQTDAGALKVVIRRQTQVIVDEAGLTREDFGRGEAVIGHRVTVQGGIERATGRFIADVVVVGPKS